MGKVIRTIAMVAAVAAIAYFAPGLGLGILHAAGSTAVAGSLAASVATAVVATALTAAAGFAMAALFPPPMARGGYAPMFAGIVQAWPPRPNTCVHALDPVAPGNDVGVFPLVGDCMRGVLPDGGWGVYDTRSTIRPGDVISFDCEERDVAWLGWDARRASGLVKRFVGFDPATELVRLESTHPRRTIEGAKARLIFAHRVRAWAPTERTARRIVRQIEADDTLYQDRIGLCVK